MSKPETDVLADEIKQALHHLRAYNYGAEADLIESALAAGAEPVAWSRTDDITNDDGGPMSVTHGAHAQPASTFAAPAESLGRDSGPSFDDVCRTIRAYGLACIDLGMEGMQPNSPTPASVPDEWRDVLLHNFPMLDDAGLDEVEHHCEWSLQQDRKRLHAMLAAPLPQQPAAEGGVFEAYKTWPDDIRKKLSAHDLRQMSGWAPKTAVGDWRIDTSAGGPILVYQNCSVIEGETARYVLRLIMRDMSSPAPGVRPMTTQGDSAQSLHPATADLVRRFADALAEKLAAAEAKYGYSDGWSNPGWMDECRKQLIHHVRKGDPRDVAAYCAFLWHHGSHTDPNLPFCEHCGSWERCECFSAEAAGREAVVHINRAALALIQSLPPPGIATGEVFNQPGADTVPLYTHHSPVADAEALLHEVCQELVGVGCDPCTGSDAPMEDLHGRIADYFAKTNTGSQS